MKSMNTRLGMVSLCALFVTGLSGQVVRPYSVIYSDNFHGGHTLFGNTSLARDATAMNYFIASPFGSNGITSIYGNDENNMQFVDIDGDASTFNSSSADLVLPPGVNTVRFARLYWGGRIASTNARYETRTSVSIRKAGGAYQALTAPAAQVDQRLLTGTTTHYAYQAYIDLTPFVNSNGPGTYTVANVALSTGSISGGGYYGGWCLVVVYENAAMPFSSVRLYDGFLQVYDGGSVVTQSITLTGLNIPDLLTQPEDAVLTTMSWEGDANLAASTANPQGDYMKINGYKVSNAVNPVNNMWNGTISRNGNFVTTKSPDYKNQMGLDIDEVPVGTGFNLPTGTSNIIVEFGTEADQYFPSIFAFTIKAKNPTVILDKTGITSLPPVMLLNPNEEITYTLSGINSGEGTGHNCVITDTIPLNLTFKRGSLVILNSPGDFKGAKTDLAGDDQACFDSVLTPVKRYLVRFYIGAGATASAGGDLLQGESYSVEFKCITPSNAYSINSVSNTGRITGHATDLTPFVDDGTFVIGPEGTPLSVKLTQFTVTREAGLAVLRWVTESEENNRAFEVERSLDGNSYKKAGQLDGQGTTGQTTRYVFTDPLPEGCSKVLYRLRIIEYGGSVSYSRVLALQLNRLLAHLSVYPNPFRDQLIVQVAGEVADVLTLRLLNAAGQPVYEQRLSVAPGSNLLQVRDMGRFTSGSYWLEIRNREEKLVIPLQKL